ncbi:MAG: hypothetical protein EOO61_21720 [Hymenobacter sp.]|nr:MAG: hypothetical protein EOO61_21720 [Hymenobacter sp.]
MRSFEIERVYHTDKNGFRYAATFQITLGGNFYTKILVNVLWNAKANLIKNTTNTDSEYIRRFSKSLAMPASESLLIITISP